MLLILGGGLGILIIIVMIYGSNPNKRE